VNIDLPELGAVELPSFNESAPAADEPPPQAQASPAARRLAEVEALILADEHDGQARPHTLCDEVGSTLGDIGQNTGGGRLAINEQRAMVGLDQNVAHGSVSPEGLKPAF
jgi:hypothetical protein